MSHAGTDPLRAAHERRRAEFTEVAGVAVPARFAGIAEYDALRTAAGVADRADRARIRMWGKDPARMLHGLITNDLLAAPEGRGVYAAMLTPKGRMLGDLRAFRLQRETPEVLIELSREALAGVGEQLRKFVPPMFARWEDASDAVRQIGVYGPAAAGVLRAALGTDVPALEEDAFAELALEGGRVLVAGTREIGDEPGFDLFVPRESVGALWESLLSAAAAAGGGPVGLAALETLRLEAGRPRYGSELSETVIPTEAYEAAGLMERAISFNKGCYTGQEVIVRIAHRGHVNRHLRGLLLGAAALPAAETPLHHAETGKEVGRVTGASHSPRFGQGLALAYLRREVEPGATVRVGAADGPAAEVIALPPRAPDAA